MFVFYFEVEVETGNGNSERGLITAENFFKALEKLTNYYGDTIMDVHMRMISDGEIICIPEEFSGIVNYIEQNAVW